MLIQDLTRLLRGEALNRPIVSQIYGFAFEPKHVKQGSAYIAESLNHDELAQAIKNGAYAIISNDKVDIIDPEIAYIKVDDLRTSLFRLMRYEASIKNLKFFYVNPIQMAILSRLNLSKNAILINQSISELFDKIMRSNTSEYFFSSCSKTLERVSPFYDQVFCDTKAKPINPSSIFFSNVICDDIFYQNLNIPRVFLPTFCGLLQFLRQNEISFRVGEIKNLGHFEPVFIDKNFYPTSFGSTFRAFITESDEELFRIETAFLQKNFDSDDVLFCLPKNLDIVIENAIYFENLNELKEIKKFRYALVFCDKNELLNTLSQVKEPKGLFDFD